MTFKQFGVTIRVENGHFAPVPVVDKVKWAVVIKDTAIFMADVDYICGMGHIPYKIERRSVTVNGVRRTRPVVMVPVHLKPKAKWLFTEWLAAEQYKQAVAFCNFVDKLRNMAKDNAHRNVEYAESHGDEALNAYGSVVNTGLQVEYMNGAVTVWDLITDKNITMQYLLLASIADLGSPA